MLRKFYGEAFSRAKPAQNLQNLPLPKSTTPFTSSKPVLSEVAKSATSEEHDSEVTLHFCEDERSLSLLSQFEPLSSGPEKVVLDHNRDSTMLSHDESLEMEN